MLALISTEIDFQTVEYQPGHLWLTFANGWTVSLAYGPCSYSDNYHLPFNASDPYTALDGGDWQSQTAEVGVYDNNHVWYDFETHALSEHCEPLGYQTVEQVIQICREIAAQPPSPDTQLKKV